MHTDSSASRTCRLSRSASLKTATVAMSSSRQARITRSAISPRFAIRTLRNIALLRGAEALGEPPTLRTRSGGLDAGAGRAARVDRRPLPVGGGEDALELEIELVGVVAVLERLFFRDEAVAEQTQHRLVEGLHVVLREAFA